MSNDYEFVKHKYSDYNIKEEKQAGGRLKLTLTKNNIRREIEFLNYALDGTYKYFVDDKLIIIDEYQDGENHGTTINFNKNGDVVAKALFDYGILKEIENE